MNKEILIGFVQGRIGLREKREKKKTHDCPKVRDRRVGSKVWDNLLRACRPWRDPYTYFLILNNITLCYLIYGTKWQIHRGDTFAPHKFSRFSD